MRIFMITRCGVFFKVFEGLRNTSGLIVEWKYKGRSLREFDARNYIRLNGREFNPTIDRVAKVWGGYGYYMYRK